MFDIGETVRQGVARAAERGVTFVTVHGDGEIIKAAVEGKGKSRLKIFAITVLTSVDQDGLHELGYMCSLENLIGLRVKQAIECGCDGIIAAPHDNPNRIRELAGEQRLLIATPGVRLAGSSVDDHKRPGTPAQAIAAGADYLIVGRPIVRTTTRLTPRWRSSRTCGGRSRRSHPSVAGSRSRPENCPLCRAYSLLMLQGETLTRLAALAPRERGDQAQGLGG